MKARDMRLSGFEYRQPGDLTILSTSMLPNTIR